ncbi:MAG: protein-L-isoaspartate O-methyltransferase [Candidatus Nealsonbacteria bacterium RIFCSPLOWO2_02_39_8]|uniref:Protein-L-isoaspartate O-methyltransferase n=1 Tax=Candidatus Nealsonbacteria bacterium RIFCSPLOWO2_02_39_8 TaxID=1801674 RepID=A0A1G2EFW8_9BACT|nr:MAG: protein-L-isoaspartate O-methyltransferase [Candidatus Nealsonbacteria bacterium RIFCSPHIGHO2_02_38_10]OGZ24689.1 MAG: protein-L-isoaspartate O-methyltransferase [Candidatus Nealsonbacteria bacterium RIFCSPLOWO2_02_39_8]
MDLVDFLVENSWLKTPRIIEAFRTIKRIDFLPDDAKDLAEINEALPIGFGQTISQPAVVAFMLEKLQPQSGEKILDIGSGSGWTSALLAHIVSGGELKSKIKGKIIAIEIIPHIKEFGERNVAEYNFVKNGIVEFICGDGSKGCEREAPYDKILTSASAEKISEQWKRQLKIDGRIICCVRESIWVVEKFSEEKFKKTEYPGFVFVPLV